MSHFLTRCNTAALLALSLLASGPVFAQHLPAAHTAGAVQYRCGGIGLDESTAMRGAVKDYPLALLFAAAGGEYLADVQVSISGASQAALQSRGSHGCSRTVERCTKRMVNTAWRFGQAKGGRQAREGGAGLCRTTASAHTCSSDAHVQEGLASVQRRNRERASSMSPRLHERSRIGHFRIQRLQAG